jgi:polyhydroxyalkanoate synthesis regulator phasin
VKTANQITKKEEMGDELKFIDFHQLQIENKKYVKEIEEKNQKLLDSKISSGKISAELLEAKKKLNEIVNQISKLEKEIAEKQRNIVELQRAKVDHEDKRHTLNEKKRKLLTQAEQMKSPNNTTEIPDVTLPPRRPWPTSSRSARRRNCSTRRRTWRGRYSSPCPSTRRPRRPWDCDTNTIIDIADSSVRFEA